MLEVTLYSQLQEVIKAKRNSGFKVKLGKKEVEITIQYGDTKYNTFVFLDGQKFLGADTLKNDTIERISNFLRKEGFKEKESLAVESIPSLDLDKIETETNTLEISGIFNSDDIDASEEYCQENGVTFLGYDGITGKMKFQGTKEQLEAIKQLFDL